MAVTRKTPSKAIPAAPAKVKDAVAVAEAFSAEATDAAPQGSADVQELLRKSTQQGLDQAKVAYEKIKGAAEETTSAVNTSCTVGMKGLTEISQKSLDAVKAGTDAQLAFFKALMGVKSPSEALALQSTFVREQFETMKAQSEDLAATAQKVARDAAEPLKGAFGKAFSIAA